MLQLLASLRADASTLGGLGSFAAGIAATAALLAGMLRWMVVRPAKNWLARHDAAVLQHVEALTKQVQPESNGGNSLTDVSHVVVALSGQVAAVRDDVAELATQQRTLATAQIHMATDLRDHVSKVNLIGETVQAIKDNQGRPSASDA
jgi:hypothetical protein